MDNKSLIYRLGYFAAKYPARFAIAILVGISFFPLMNKFSQMQIEQKIEDANRKQELLIAEKLKSKEVNSANESDSESSEIRNSLVKVNEACAYGNGLAKNILGSNEENGVHSFCFGFNSSLGDLVNKTKDFESDLVKMSFKLGACDSINQMEAEKYMKLGAGKAASCAILTDSDQSNCFNNMMSACTQIMQESIKASQIMGAASSKFQKSPK